MSERSRLRVGTRGSALALAQTEEVVAALRTFHPHLDIQVITVATRPDTRQEDPLEAFERGMFVKELETALLGHHADIAVHSLKDLPTVTPPQLTLAAILQRQDPRDALVSRSGLYLQEMPQGSRIGTSSPRRACQVRALRGDMELVPIRGNVDTRLRKVQSGQYDAVVLAAAGLARLGLLDQATQLFSPDEVIPAPGQGALAVETRADDQWAQVIVAPLNHAPTAAAVAAERAFLAHLGGGCRVPFAAYGEMAGAVLKLTGLISDEAGQRRFTAVLQGDLQHPEALGARLAQRLLEMGAQELLEAAAHGG